MKLEELTVGTPISIIAYVNDEELNFKSTIQETYPRKRFIVADPIYEDEKIITFHGNNITVDVLVALEKDKPQLFKNVKIAPMKKADKSLCYGISSPTESKGINRRENFRCFVGKPTQIKCGISQDIFPAILRDVSVSGFAVVTDNDLELRQNQVIHAMLEDYIDELGESFSFHLYGLIVRIQPLENGKFVYGCRLSTRIGGLENYITKKERIALRKSNENSRR